MNTLTIDRTIRTNHKKFSISKLAFAIVLAGFSLTSQADKITSTPAAAPNVQDGFGGLNFDNIDVILNGLTSVFNPLTGEYTFDPDSDFSYESRVYPDSAKTADTEVGIVLAKDWPVGEPAGIKIVNDDFDVQEPKPTNCIMSTSYLDGHYLDDALPKMVICSSSFQGHKR